MDRRARGILLIVLSTVAFSSAGFFTRLIPLDAWTLLFWRGVFAAPLILAIIAIQERRRTLAALCAIGRPGLAVAACSTAATIFYLTALRHTSVADVAVILAAAPFVTAGLAWLWLGLPGAGTTLLASLAALAGVSIMVGGSAADGSLLGDLLAFGTTVCLAVMLLILRRHEATPMLPAACLSAALCPLVAWPFAAPFAVGATDMAYLFLFGTAQFGLGMVLLMLGSRAISATENALLNTLEMPLAVAWVWLCFAEVPAAASLAGGIIVIAAVAAQVWFGAPRDAPALAAPPQPSASRE